jgi:flagellar biogenesis protein FliO
MEGVNLSPRRERKRESPEFSGCQVTEKVPLGEKRRVVAAPVDQRRTFSSDGPDSVMR